MLKNVRAILIILFVLALAGAGGLYFYKYTHDDTSPPAFQSDSDLLEVSVKDPEQALLQGLHAYDNVDGDLTAKIRIREVSPFVNETDARVSYIVFDAASNYAVYSRTLRYTDYAPPHFELKRPMIFNVGQTVSFRDAVSVYDLRDGNISGRLKLEESTVISSSPGTYTARLSATNSMGDTVYLPLSIQVIDKSVTRPSIQLTKYLIYVEQGTRFYPRHYVISVNDPMQTDQDHPIPVSSVSFNDSGLDTSTPGVYEVYYYYTGISGEHAAVILTVIVE